MKHYVLGFVFSRDKDAVLLCLKKRPTFLKGLYNGIGGKIENAETPLHAMERESIEETGRVFCFVNKVTFICDGGTVFVYRAITSSTLIEYNQKEDEELKVYPINALPRNIVSNLAWIIPICLSDDLLPPTLIYKGV